MSSIQEIQGRKGRVVTDRDATDISRVEELSYELKIGEVMSRDVISVQRDIHMVDLLELYKKARISGTPVIDHDELVGIISIEDLIVSLCAMDVEAPVEKYMTTKVLTVKAYEPVVEAIKIFMKTGVGRLPVIDDSNHVVGMITKGDVTRGVLVALEKDYKEEEVRRYRASHLFEDINSDRTSLILRYQIKQGDFAQGGNASSNIKRALIRLGASPQIARRCGIAIYEAEINLIIHTTNGGYIRVEIEPHRITMRATDDGPGIENVDLALRPGFSTATEEIRELGFGAGMGLPNISRCVDKMSLESTPGVGTRLTMIIYLQPEESFREAGPADGN